MTTDRDAVERLAPERIEAWPGMTNRVEYDENGDLDEVVTDAGMHLERLSKKGWFLSGERSDGTSIATKTVTTIGKRIFSVFETGRSSFILIIRSSFVVSAFIIGGWITGTRAI